MNAHRCCPHHRHHHGYHQHEHGHEEAPEQQVQAASQLPVQPRKRDAGPAAPSEAVQTPAAAAALKAELVQQEAAKENGAKKPLPNAGAAGIPQGSKKAPPFSLKDERPQVDAAGVGKGVSPVTAPGTRAPEAPSLKPVLKPDKAPAADNQKKPELKDGIRVGLPTSNRPPIPSAPAGGTTAVEASSKRDAAQPQGATKSAAAPTVEPGPAKSTAGNLPTGTKVASTKVDAALATQKKAMNAKEVKTTVRASQPKLSTAEPPVTPSNKDDAGARARMLAAPSKRVINGALRANNKPEVLPNLPEKRAAPKEVGSSPKLGAPLIDKTKEADLKKGSTVIPQGPKPRGAADHAKSPKVWGELGAQPREEVPPLASKGPPRSFAPGGKLPSTAPLKQGGRLAAPQSAGKSDAEAAAPVTREAPRRKGLNEEFEIGKEPRKIPFAEEAIKAEPPKAAVNKAPAFAVSGRPINKVVKDAGSKTAKATDTAKGPRLERKSQTEKVVRKDYDAQDSSGDGSPTLPVKKLSVADAAGSKKTAAKNKKPTAQLSKFSAQAKGKPVVSKAHGQEVKRNKDIKQKPYSESSSESREASKAAMNEEVSGFTKYKSGAREGHTVPSDKKPHAALTKSRGAPPLLHGARKGAARKPSVQVENETKTEEFSAVDESPEEVHVTKAASQKARKVHKEKKQKVEKLQPHAKTKAAVAKKEKPVYTRDESPGYKQSARNKKAPKQTHPAKGVAPDLPLLARLSQLFPIAHKLPHKGGRAEHSATPSEIHTAHDFSRRSTVTQMGSMFRSTSAQASTEKRAKTTLASETGTGAAGTSVAGTTAAPTSRAGSAIDTTAATTAAVTTAATEAATTQGTY
ncbi:hypothetical protein V5799_020308 [Amblyomma americanum]|uniref:Uncharacterized protein n=1 Tax=Amblyomma americanum TaxID=6943 RepID=A0AAQ4EUA2_AMBAM